MLLLAPIALAIWIVLSISAGLLFGRMATLNAQSELRRRASRGDRPRTIPVLRFARDRAA